ncbi:MAG: ABC transporter permease subunit [Bacteroidales bacterium]|nr:ABC transporter permease subunit [Bacteroidales bacterium]
MNYLEFGDSIIAGSLTLGLLTLPVVIRTTEEALKSVDDSLRLGSYALGATKLQTIRRVVLPVAYPNIITGLILYRKSIRGNCSYFIYGSSLFPAQVANRIIRSGNGPALPSLCAVNQRYKHGRIKANGLWYSFVLIAIVLIINTTASFFLFGLACKKESKWINTQKP